MSGQLDRTTTNCCKGIAAIIIMLHHISFRLSNLPVYVKPMWYIAFPIVGFFFFMSGYGLTCGLMKKKDYLRGFLSRRLSNIVVPYVIVAIVWIGLEIIGGGKHLQEQLLKHLQFDTFNRFGLYGRLQLHILYFMQCLTIQKLMQEYIVLRL